MISKELLSEVLNEDVKEVYEIGSNPNFKDNTLLFHLVRSGELCDINIYELQHRMKEWARINFQICLISGSDEWAQGSYNFVCYQTNIYRPDAQSRLKRPLVKHKFQVESMYANSEPEAIFKACQWIYDNIRKQG